MTDTPENLVLEHLRAMRGDMQRLHEDNREIKARLNEVFTQVVGLRRDQANDAETMHRVQVVVDRLGERIDRIEARLQITDS